MPRLMLLPQTSAGDGAALARSHGMVTDAIGCRPNGGEEIVVSARRRATRSPYRLPVIAGEDGFDPAGPDESVSRERHRLMDVGGAGAQAGACSAAGASGSTGCFVKSRKERAEQRGFRPE